MLSLEDIKDVLNLDLRIDLAPDILFPIITFIRGPIFEILEGETHQHRVFLQGSHQHKALGLVGQFLDRSHLCLNFLTRVNNYIFDSSSLFINAIRVQIEIATLIPS